jgi:hypothetical protein
MARNTMGAAACSSRNVDEIFRIFSARSGNGGRHCGLNGESTPMTVPTVADFAEFSSAFSGHLLTPADVGYEEARRVHNGLVDKRPAVIARCRGVADVVDAINLTRKLGLEVAVRGGGHNVAGRATIDGGLVIDLTP